MDAGAAAPWIVIPIQIIFIDLLLGADNAVVIAMACRTLRPEDTRKAILFGTGGAIVLRFVLTVLAGFLFTAPYIRLAGAAILFVIAVSLLKFREPNEATATPDPSNAAGAPGGGLRGAVLLILIVDTAMSLDNVVAIAAVARGDIWLLALGVLFSIPLLMSGSLVLANLLKRHPPLTVAGCALLGWVAGGMAAEDRAIAGWLHAHAPTFAALAPALGAACVLAWTLGLALSGRRRGIAGAPSAQPVGGWIARLLLRRMGRR
jgi:YjbE family integral membrane protein